MCAYVCACASACVCVRMRTCVCVCVREDDSPGLVPRASVSHIHFLAVFPPASLLYFKCIFIVESTADAPFFLLLFFPIDSLPPRAPPNSSPHRGLCPRALHTSSLLLSLPHLRSPTHLPLRLLSFLSLSLTRPGLALSPGALVVGMSVAAGTELWPRVVPCSTLSF